MAGDEELPAHYPTYEDMEKEIIDYPTRIEELSEICPYLTKVVQLNLRRAYVDDEGLALDPLLRTSQQWIEMVQEMARGLEGPKKPEFIRESYESLVEMEKKLFINLISRMLIKLKRRVLPFTKLMDDLVDARNQLVTFRQKEHLSIKALENDVKPILQNYNDIAMKMWSHGVALIITFVIAIVVAFIAGTLVRS